MPNMNWLWCEKYASSPPQQLSFLIATVTRSRGQWALRGRLRFWHRSKRSGERFQSQAQNALREYSLLAAILIYMGKGLTRKRAMVRLDVAAILTGTGFGLTLSLLAATLTREDVTGKCCSRFRFRFATRKFCPTPHGCRRGCWR